MKLAGYDVRETIGQEQLTLLFRADRDDREVLLKTSADPSPSLGLIERLRHEHSVLIHLADCQHVAQALEFRREGDRPVLVLKDPGGATLEQLIGTGMELAAFLEAALAATEAVGKLHQRGVVHNDLRPANILITSGAAKAHLLNLGFASLLPLEYRAQDSTITARALPYMSPEQSGRMNRAVDYRTDFYSLGVSFYEALTGERPFQADDTLEWFYCHLAKNPQPVREVRKDVPPLLSQLVSKLLSKLPEERYQSAAGLRRDLERCIAELDPNAHLPPYTLGAHDLQKGLNFPGKLYGREFETATLMAAFDDVVSSGQTALVLVAGYSGIGKTSLVQELHRPIVKARGVFTSGKFDQFRRDAPYVTLIQALQSMIRQILTQDETAIATWRERFGQALGDNGQVLVDVLPDLGHIIGDQEPVLQVGAVEARNRFLMVFRRFLGALARPEHPLLIFLDDMQWADAATLELLEDVLADPEIRDILFLAAYRDNEVDAAHPLTLAIERLRSAGVPLSQIDLSPLTSQSVLELVADTLHRKHSDPEVARLSKLIGEKTDGNPFFVRALITRLYADGLLTQHPSTGRFEFDPAGVADADYTANVADHLVQRIHSLPASTQRLLQLAACAGNHFDLADLCLAADDSPDRVAQNLWPAVQALLIAPVGTAYKSARSPDHDQLPPIHFRFMHDRVQHAAYAILDPTLRAQTHARIGRGWWLSQRTVEERLFELANHLNLATDLLSPQERKKLATLNLRAARRAQSSGAYHAALSLTEHGATGRRSCEPRGGPSIGASSRRVLPHDRPTRGQPCGMRGPSRDRARRRRRIALAAQDPRAGRAGPARRRGRHAPGRARGTRCDAGSSSAPSQGRRRL